MSTHLVIATIGSRSTPVEICDEMTNVGIWIREHGEKCRSGHAQGADYAFELGAEKSCEVFLPKIGFNSHLTLIGTVVQMPSDPEYLAKSDELVRRFHPAPQNLKPYVWPIMRRNNCQVLGANLDSPVDATVCWAPGDKGGTGQAIRISEGHGIPVIRMHLAEFATAELVIVELERILEEKVKANESR